jgi:hypothetical protein
VCTEEENSGEELSDKALQSSSEHDNPPPPAAVDQQQQEGLHQQQQLQPSEVEPSPSPKSGCRGKTSPNIRTRQLFYNILSFCLVLHMIFLMFFEEKKSLNIAWTGAGIRTPLPPLPHPRVRGWGQKEGIKKLYLSNKK